MNDTNKGLLFLMLGLTCFWFVFDEFFGKKRLSNLAGLMTPSIPSLTDTISKSIDTALNGDPKKKEKVKQEEKKKVDDGKTVTPPGLPFINGKAKNDKTKQDIKKGIDSLYGPSLS